MPESQNLPPSLGISRARGRRRNDIHLPPSPTSRIKIQDSGFMIHLFLSSPLIVGNRNVATTPA